MSRKKTHTHDCSITDATYSRDVIYNVYSVSSQGPIENDVVIHVALIAESQR